MYVCMYSYTQTYTHTYTHTHTHTPVRTHDDVVAIDFYADGVVKIVELVVELNARPKEHTRNTQGTHKHSQEHIADTHIRTHQGLLVDSCNVFSCVSYVCSCNVFSCVPTCARVCIYKDTYQGLNVDRASGFGFRVSGLGFRV